MFSSSELLHACGFTTRLVILASFFPISISPAIGPECQGEERLIISIESNLYKATSRYIPMNSRVPRASASNIPRLSDTWSVGLPPAPSPSST
jgi:hypothetical protein